MLVLLFLIIEIVNPCRTQRNTGTTLFYGKQFKTDCWNEDDLAKLRARMIFDQLIPHQVTPDKVNKKFINDAMLYYRRALRTVDQRGYSRTKTLLKETLVDTIGGHFRSELLPTARFAYYAGYVPYRKVRELHEFYDELKLILNTQGQGWKRPSRVPQLTNLTVVKIMVGPGRLFDPCSCLVVQRNANSCIRLPTPRVDDESDPSAIALPFKHGGLVKLLSPKSENILLKYYTTAARCILRSSPESCRHGDFVNFNNDLWHWMKRDVAPHLMDEKLYAAYGGVLRVAAAVQNYGKGLSRRNLFEFSPSPVTTKWQPWKALTESYVYVNSDLNPGICVALVALAALVICFLQMLFNYMFGNADAGCQCVGPKKSESKQVAYANVDSNFPAMLPASDAYYDNNDNKTKGSRRTVDQIQPSVGTKKVYNLLENTEQYMNIVMSDAEEEESFSTESDSEDSNDKDADYAIEASNASRSTSPPKIETSIAQLKINKGSSQLRSSSRVGAGSGAGGGGGGECWAWSGGSSGSSGESGTGSSGSTTTRSRPPSRDLAWARRVLSTHSATRTTSATEMDRNSFTTTKSHRQ